MLLSLPEVAVRAFVFCYLADRPSDRKGIMRWLSDVLAVCQPESGDAMTASISERSLRHFLVKGGRPSPETLNACIHLLSEEGYIVTEHALFQTQRSRKSKSKVDSYVTKGDLQGTFYQEEIEDFAAVIYSLTVARADKNRIEFDSFRSRRDYSRRSSELSRSFERRLDEGLYDSLSEHLGRFFRLGAWWRYEFHIEKGGIDWNSEMGAVVSEGSFLSLIASRGTIKSNFQRIAPLDFKSFNKSTNLTKRQKSNILKYSPRFVLGGQSLTKERGMSNDLSGADIAFLQAARDQDALAMMAALARGANINGVDPLTGQTALHIAAADGEPICIFVLVHEPNFHSDLVQAVVDETDLSTGAVDLAVRQAQAKLDPTILDHKGRFALNCAPLPPADTDLSADPTSELQLRIASLIYIPTSNALKALGVSPDVTHDDYVTPDERARIMAAATSVGEQNQPPPEPEGMG